MNTALSFLLLSRHDYRSKRKANVHFIAKELANIGNIRFFSSSFSALSLITGDQRLSLWRRTNSVERIGDVDTYLWRTSIHPCKVPSIFQKPMNKYFYHYSRKVPKQLLRWIGESDVVLMESGGPEIFFDIVRVTNPRCKIIYICSDALETIGCATYVLDEFRRVVRHFDGVRIPSRLLSSAFPKDCKLYFVPHGLDPDSLKTSAPSPYTGGANIVSVGNMLFDPQFFETAAKLFPEVHFHVIGGGRRARNLAASNITVYGEMPFKETLPYIKYADAGVAPYDDDRVSPYLTDTSMKLMQYNYFGLPAICPAVLAGGHQSRFGYIREKPNSIQDAVARALSCGPFQGSTYLTWAEVTQRILFPERFPETFLN